MLIVLTVSEEVLSIFGDLISHSASDGSLLLVSFLRFLLSMTREYDLCDWVYLNEPASKNRMRVIFCIVRTTRPVSPKVVWPILDSKYLLHNIETFGQLPLT